MTAASSTPLTPAPAAPAAGWLAAPPVRLTVMDGLGERALASEFVGWEDFHDCIGEAWLECTLRRGHPERVPDYGSLVLRPEADATGLCKGFTISGLDSGGGHFSRTFPVGTLAPVADRLAAGLVDRGVLAPDALFTYVAHMEAPSAVAIGAACPRREPLAVARVPMRVLLERARRVDAADAEAGNLFPAFLTAECLRLMERHCRSGALLSPPVESGCALIGALVSCPDSGEFGVVVFDVIEIKDAEVTTTTLRPRDGSWAMIHRVLRARQSQPGQQTHRLVGLAHGHPFPPAGEQCQACRLLPTCSKASVFLSREDVNFFRSAFAGMPWQLAPVFGQTARGDHVHGVFGRSGGRFRLRSYHVLEDADDLVERLSQPVET